MITMEINGQIHIEIVHLDGTALSKEEESQVYQSLKAGNLFVGLSSKTIFKEDCTTEAYKIADTEVGDCTEYDFLDEFNDEKLTGVSQ